MIRHIVLLDFVKEFEGKTAIAHAVMAKDLAQELENKIDVLKHIEVGVNEADADPTNYTFSLVCDFDSLEDLQKYQQHPEHLKLSSFFSKVTCGRVCVDYEI